MPLLPTIDFPTSAIKLHAIYYNELVLQAIRDQACEKVVPSKVQDVYGPFFLPPAPKERPYIYGSFVLSLDGKLSFEDQKNSTAISKGNRLNPDGGLADLWLLNMLRTYADGILIGTQTLKVEKNITGHIYDASLRQDRNKVLKKAAPIPWNIIFSRDGNSFPFKHRIFTHQEIPLCLITTTTGLSVIEGNLDIPFVTLKATDISGLVTLDAVKGKHVVVIVAQKHEGIDLTLALRALRAIGVKRLLLESPALFYLLMQQSLVDEAFINYSTLYAGGGQGLGSQFPFNSHKHPSAELLSIHLHDAHFIYTRQRLHYQA